MHGRMIHGTSATGSPIQSPQAYDVHGRNIYAVDRGGLNGRLLDELDRLPNVKVFFHHKLTGADFRSKKAWFEVRTSSQNHEENNRRAPEIEVSFDMLLGADGAHSAARFHMMKFEQLNFSQEYIDTLWCEFTIPPSSKPLSSLSSAKFQLDFSMSPNHLHIWPAGDFMFIAIPSLDKSFTCTLFGPTSLFNQLEEGINKNDSTKPSALETLFAQSFPGVVPDLVSSEDLHAQFKRNPHLPLINIKCSPHHYSNCVVILGDAANAVVPFYGQGMNAGLESVRILFQYLDQHGVYNESNNSTSSKNHATSASKDKNNVKHSQGVRRTHALQAYTAHRVPDTHAIADLALQNYVEMRSSVRSPMYRLRKIVEENLDRYLPQLGWATQYSRVSFGNERYSRVKEWGMWQGRVLERVGWSMLFLMLGIGGGVALRKSGRTGPVSVMSVLDGGWWNQIFGRR